MNENQSHEIKLNIFKRATLYIEKFGSFAPFAMAIALITINYNDNNTGRMNRKNGTICANSPYLKTTKNE
ncbi:hypothetical protein [Sphingobacterium multivorum]|uniref:hypothetical protein n=1 Tax=Sphingobacterium multivorum TaxID=28454 RepID=UPI0028A86C8A|nr:hypothetical protein [Sphingobacterium multivorum]